MDQKEQREVIIGPAIVASANALRAFDAPVRYPLILKNFALSLTNPSVANRSAFIVLIEHIIGSVLVLILLFSRRAVRSILNEIHTFHRRDWFSFVLVSIGSGLGLYFFMLALAFGNPTISILMQKSQPLITLGVAMLILNERPTKFFYLALFFSIIGILLMIWESLGSSSSNELLAAIFSLIAAGFWGSNTVWGRILSDKVGYWNLTTLRYFGGTTILIIFNFIIAAYTQANFNILSETILTFGTAWSPINLSIEMSGFLAIFLATIFTGGIIPLSMYYFGLRWSKASVGGLAELAFPVLAIFINFIFLGFGLSPLQLAGAIILFIVVSIMSFINKKEYEKDHSPS